MPTCSVVICTHDRPAELEKCLAGLKAQTLNPTEVLVVDNNSTDRTPDLVASFCRQYPGRFRYLFEPRSGKSHALNTGIREAQGEILAFIDDDVVVEPNWLENLTAALANGEWVGAGGRILPERTFSPPRWIPLQDAYALAPLAMFAPDLEAGPLKDTPFGANMAFQRRVFEKYGGFRTDLGPEPGGRHPQKSEDSEFGHRLLAAGERFRYEPSAVVYHSVPANRLHQKYFLGGLIKLELTSGHLGFRPMPSGSLVAFRSISFEGLSCGPFAGWQR